MAEASDELMVGKGTPSVAGRCCRGEVDVAKLGVASGGPAADWKAEISRVVGDDAMMYTDGSRDEKG